MMRVISPLWICLSLIFSIETSGKVKPDARLGRRVHLKDQISCAALQRNLVPVYRHEAT